jgi:hypothetical protein
MPTRRPSLVVSLVSVVGVLSCTRPTQLVVFVTAASELREGEPSVAVAVAQTRDASGALVDGPRSFVVPEAGASFGVVPLGGDASRVVTVQVAACANIPSDAEPCDPADTLASSSITTSFLPEQSVTIRLELSGSCSAYTSVERCPESTSCSTESGDPRCTPTSAVTEGTVRLVEGEARRSGRLEIFHEGEWGTVCDDGFETVDASVVCRQLGLPGLGGARTCLEVERGVRQIWLDNVDCAGPETSLSSCASNGWGVHNCSHADDVWVECGESTDAGGDDRVDARAQADVGLDAAVAGDAAITPDARSCAEEICNGIDDDCDSRIDEGTRFEARTVPFAELPSCTFSSPSDIVSMRCHVEIGQWCRANVAMDGCVRGGVGPLQVGAGEFIVGCVGAHGTEGVFVDVPRPTGCEWDTAWVNCRSALDDACIARIFPTGRRVVGGVITNFDGVRAYGLCLTDDRAVRLELPTSTLSACGATSEASYACNENLNDHCARMHALGGSHGPVQPGAGTLAWLCFGG